MGLGSLVGGIAGAAGGYMSAKESAKAMKEATEMQIKWEKERAANAHQWEVNDLQAAGLNPILSAGGSGAETSGITPPMPDTSGYATAGKAIGNAVQTALQEKQVKANVENYAADTDLKKAQALESAANAALHNKRALTEISTTAKNYAETMLKDQEFKQKAESWNTKLEQMKTELETAKENKKYTKYNVLLKEYENEMKKYSWWLKQINEGGRTAAAGLMGATSAAKLALEFIPSSKAISFLTH